MPDNLAHRLRLLVGIFTLLSCVYLFTYSASIESSDTWFLFNGVGSLVHFGDWGQDLTADEKFPTPATVRANSRYPLRDLIDDPLSVLLATPLYWLADKLPGVGLIHAVWLFNVFVTAAAGCVMFVYALTLGYDERVGVVAALAFGLGTIVWAYSKTFFQENLTLLVTLSLALALERWRMSRCRSWRALIPVIVLALCLPYAKWSSVIAVPGLLLIAMPTLVKRDSHVGRLMPYVELALFAALMLLLLLLAYTGLARVLGIDWGNIPFSRIPIFPQYMQRAVQSYLFSIGASVWGTSPILLLALPGFWMLYRQRRTRYIWAALLIVVAYASGYALLRSVHWFGGLSWPPRFLVPTVPFLMLCALPVLQRMLNRQDTHADVGAHQRVRPTHSQQTGEIELPRIREHRETLYIETSFLRVVFVVLMLYGVWVQWSAVSFRWGVYPSLLPPDTGESWGGGINTVPYLRWVVLPRLWGQMPFDFAWVRMDKPLWAVMFAALAAVSAGWLFRIVRRGAPTCAPDTSPRKIPSMRWHTALGTMLLMTALLICVYLGLRMIYDDPEYFAYNTALFDMLPIVETETQPGDVVLVTGREHRQFLLNYGRSERWRGIGVSYLPGERYVPDVEPLVTATNLVNPTVDELLPLLPENTPWLIAQLAAQHPRLWLLTEFGSDMAWTVRPLERYLTRLYYPVREFSTSPAVRLLEYNTTPAPSERETTTDFIFGDTIRLIGYALPLGTEYAAGDTLPISLFWQAEQTIPQDYTVASFLTQGNGVAVQGRDSAPDGGFARTSLWSVGVQITDNRALILPANLASGDYNLWLLLYPTGTDGSQRLTVTGGDTHEGTIAVLPVTISVQ